MERAEFLQIIWRKYVKPVLIALGLIIIIRIVVLVYSELTVEAIVFWIGFALLFLLVRFIQWFIEQFRLETQDSVFWNLIRATLRAIGAIASVATLFLLYQLWKDNETDALIDVMIALIILIFIRSRK